MHNKLLSIILCLITALQLHAVTVTTTAGELAMVVTDYSITNLTINGTIDARDFKFIADNLENLKSLNLAGVTISAYNSTLDDQMIAGVYNHEANTLPYCAMTGMTRLESIVLPQGLVAIDYGAMAGCTSLASISIPYSVSRIGDDAFNSCSSLTHLEFPGRITYLGSRAFIHCSNLAAVNLYPKNPLVIGDEAFADCVKLTNVNIGKNVTKIGNGAFDGCTALKVVFFLDESKLEEVGDRAFYNTGLKSIDFARTPMLKHLGAWALARTHITHVNIPAHVKSLDEGTLFYNKALTNIELPTTLTYLPDYMLAGCDQVDVGFMTRNLGNIGDYALYNQSQHESITVPYKVYYIGSHAMAGMTGLNEITSEPLVVPELGDEVWQGVDQSRVSLNVNGQSINDYMAAMQWMDFVVGEAQLRGDVNNDGFVNYADVVGERRLIVDGSSQGLDMSRTDVNGDERVNVGDIVSIYNIINGSQPAYKPYRTYFDDIVEGLGTAETTTTVNLDILLDNAIDYTAFQFSITTPTHISITNATLSQRCLAHEIHSGSDNGQHYTIVGFSPTGENIEGDNGVLLSLSISSTRPITINNTDYISLDEILFADKNENVYKRNDVKINLLGSSALDNVVVDQSSILVDVYNTQGQLLRTGVPRSEATNGLPHGIYIVGGKKVIVR